LSKSTMQRSPGGARVYREERYDNPFLLGREIALAIRIFPLIGSHAVAPAVKYTGNGLPFVG